MKAALKFAALALAATALSNHADAAVFVFGGLADGLQEVPPNASPGTGSATVTYDSTAHTLRVQAVFSGLLGTTTASHIHIGDGPGTAGGVVTQTPSFVGFPLGVTSGSYDSTFDLTLAASYNPAFVTANGGSIAGSEAALFAGLAAGKAYLNIHSSLFRSGEIRADLGAVPEPASWALMIGGLALAGGALRTRRRIAFA